MIALVCDYLGYEGISTHSFRKWYATSIYTNRAISDSVFNMDEDGSPEPICDPPH